MREDADLFFTFAASGFRDFTRIAASHPEMWRDICLANRDALLLELDSYRAQLDNLRLALARNDGERLSEEIFGIARQARRESGLARAEMIRLLRALLLVLALALPTITVSAEPPAILLAEVYRNQVDVYSISSAKSSMCAPSGTVRCVSAVASKSVHRDGSSTVCRRRRSTANCGSPAAFERLSGIVRKDYPDRAEWRQVCYMIFELPGAPGVRERAEAVARSPARPRCRG